MADINNNIKILLVEDDAVEALDIKRILRSFGYSIPHVASTGEDAIKKAFELMPDAILMDILLKGNINGIETANKIKKLNIPIIYLTAHSDDLTVQKAMQTEPYGYILKPFSPMDLKFSIELAIYKNKIDTQLKKSESKYNSLFENMLNAFAYHQIVIDENNNPIDYIFIKVNQAFENLTGLKRKNIIGKKVTEVIPEIKATDSKLINLYGNVALTGKSKIFELYFEPFDKFYSVNAYSEEKGYFATIFEDITQLKEADKKIKNIQKEKIDTIKKLNEAQEIAKIGSWDWDLKTNKVWWSNETYNIFEVKKDYIPSYEKNSDFIHPDDLETYQKEFEKSIKTGKDIGFDLRIVTKSGKVKNCNAHGRVIKDNSKKPIRIIGTLIDISERVESEYKINKLYRLYATLSQVNQAIVRVKDKKELFKIICQVSIEYGKFEMAWIGLINKETGKIEPTSHYGNENGYLEIISLNTEEEPSLYKPSILAANKGEIVIQNNIKKELKRSWRDEAIKRNYRSLASIPIKSHDEIIGIFNIYSSETNFFTKDEVKLVEEMGLDVSMAITSIESDKKRRNIEDALYESEKNYQGLFNSMLDGFAVHEIILDDENKPVDYRFLKANPAFEDLTGLKVKDILGRTITEVIPNIERKWIQMYGEVALSGKGAHFEQYAKTLEKYFKIAAFSQKKGEFATIFEDITHQKKAEQDLKFYIEWLNLAQHASKSGFWDWDMVNNKLTWSSEFLELFGLPPETEPSFEIWEDVLHPDDHDQAMKKIESSIEEHKFLENEYRIIFSDGSERWIGAWGSTTYDTNDQAQRMSGICIDITERKKAEKDLLESEKRFRMLFELNNSIMMLIEPESGHIIDANPSASKFYGYSLKTLKSMNINEINQLKSEEVYIARQKAVQEESNYFIFPHKLANGEIRTVEVFSSPIDFKNKTMLFSIVNDISQRKLAEEKIQKSLEEKENLLREVHHRVKNNLQIVSSLLNLQSYQVKDENDKELFQISQARLKSMALIHEKLYRSSDLSSINFREYSKHLASELLTNYGAINIDLIVDVEDITLNIDTSVPCGLIINELVSNSLKYAFPDGRNGKISITLKTDNNGYMLTISDDGIGFPEDLDFRNTDSLGLQLVNSLVKQIEGEIRLDRSNGTKYEIKFKELIYKKRSSSN
jgi:PAS domain S-box-containing protein